MERFRCASCDAVLSVPVRLVAMPPPPVQRWLVCCCHQVNPPLMQPLTYTIDQAPHGRDRIAGTFVLSPGDVRGTRFVHELVDEGCWPNQYTPSMECARCGTLVASRGDDEDCDKAQETRFYPHLVVRESCGESPATAQPFALMSDWDTAAPDSREVSWAPEPFRPRPELVATRWRDRGLQQQLLRDDPPA
ncbi:hypothetical protein Rhe02_08430 [Rhizocola hellebori]|uniref:Uncharacterized protein n=1 Tax=Rhizocola hellebori TaxID=1392758 RepID=A0A8J3Q345_9ACTN|nr:hypothetical protein [Rhizocola hellebori]GIH02776.1 hypothetical protein Rhe02_08430 [Rhizocola hellebori]